MEEWLDASGWRPGADGELFQSRICEKISTAPKWIAPGGGIEPTQVSPRSLRGGCETKIYAAGIDPMDIQRWGRWRSSIYMRYIWRGNLRLHHLGDSLVASTRLADRSKVDLGRGADNFRRRFPSGRGPAQIIGFGRVAYIS